MSNLLEVQKLTMRFGGLTAVDGVDLSVEQGQIASVIGPNGAGKTTVFNAISGVYEPTSGTIALEGRQLRRPLTWRVIAACIAIGIATGIASGLLLVDIDKLWLASIKQNYLEDGVPFSWSAAATSARAYWRGDLIIAPAGRRFKITSADGSHSLGRFKTREQAEEQLSVLQSQPPDADDSDMAEVRRDNRSRRRNAWLGLLGGTLLGGLGSFSVWSRARRTPDYVSRSGIARTFQNIRLFKHMTVLENVLVGLDRKQRTGILRMALRTPAVRRENRAAELAAAELLDFVALRSSANELAKNLAYGDQRRLEIARALALDPRLVLLDEPAAGMNPSESADLMHLIERIRQRGVTVLLIEHHMKLVMGISDHVAVLDYGRKIAEGTPDAVQKNPAVIKAYLGDEDVS